jgi:hypothetical protein
MKTMMDLLVSLRRMDTAADAAFHSRQLSPGEKQAARRHLDLVREIVPPEVLLHYDNLKTTATDLVESPELLAMAVLLTTYRSLSPAERKKLLKHFTNAPQHRATGDSRAPEVRMPVERRRPRTRVGSVVPVI